MKKDSRTALIFCVVAMGLLILVFSRGEDAPTEGANAAARVENGTQLVEILAKDGYTPSSVTAQAGVPTVLRLTTNGTYDCSSSIVIPSLGYQTILPATGSDDIPLSADQAHGTLKGTCGMGMFRFQIDFK